jgi:hypothetical protein
MLSLADLTTSIVTVRSFMVLPRDVLFLSLETGLPFFQQIAIWFRGFERSHCEPDHKRLPVLSRPSIIFGLHGNPYHSWDGAAHNLISALTTCWNFCSMRRILSCFESSKIKKRRCAMIVALEVNFALWIMVGCATAKALECLY